MEGRMDREIVENERKGRAREGGRVRESEREGRERAREEESEGRGLPPPTVKTPTSLKC